MSAFSSLYFLLDSFARFIRIGREILSLSPLRTLTLVGAVGIVCGGFVWGRSLGSENARRGGSTLPQILSANAKTLFRGRPLSPASDDDTVDPLTTMGEVLTKVEEDFVWGITNEARMSNGAIQSAFLSLNDPKTYFLDRAMRRNRQAALSGTYHGIGAVTVLKRGTLGKYPTISLTLVSVAPGSPAEKAGLKTGDRLTYLNDKWVVAYPSAYEVEQVLKAAGKDVVKQRELFKVAQEKFNTAVTVSKASSLLNTGEGKTYKLKVERPGSVQPLTVTVTTAVTKVDPVAFSDLGHQVYELKILQFNQKSSGEIQSALDKVPASAKGLILDLRQNFGGVKSVSQPEIDGYNTALKLIGRLTGGTTLKLEKKPKLPQSITVASSGKPIRTPLVVLTDEGTSNLAELVASTLRETRKAKIVGAKTYGDPILQLHSVFENGTGAEIATAKLLNSAGTDWSQGLIPDILAGSDAPQRALALLTRS